MEVYFSEGRIYPEVLPEGYILPKEKYEFSERIMVASQLLPHLLWWTEAAHLSEGMPFQQPPHQVTVTTDAPKEGWGGHVQTPDRSLL